MIRPNARAFAWIASILASATIVALLLVTLRKLEWSREITLRTSCQSDINQVNLVLKLYAQDSDGHYPRHDIPNVGATDVGGYRMTHWPQALQPWCRSINIFQCPREAGNPGTDYYLNLRASGAKETAFKYAANSVLLTEGNGTPVGSWATATAPITSGYPIACARHLDGSNYAFADGHINWLLSSQAPGNQPASRGGFTFNS